MTNGATMPSSFNPATKVWVCHLPNGALARRRCPFVARPYSRVRLVLTLVSSRKISRPGLARRLRRRSIHSVRSAATSGRSCSAASSVFFCASARSGSESAAAKPGLPSRPAGPEASPPTRASSDRAQLRALRPGTHGANRACLADRPAVTPPANPSAAAGPSASRQSWGSPQTPAPPRGTSARDPQTPPSLPENPVN